MLLLSGILIGMLELGLRWVYPLDTDAFRKYRIPHPRFGWVLMPGASYVNRLAEKFVAGQPLTPAVGVTFPRRGRQSRGGGAGAGPRRFLHGGVFGAFLDSLPARLERLTNRAERQVEVINLGVGGYGTLQEYLVFDAIGRAYRPDVVVLAMFLRNDLQDNSLTLASLFRSCLRVTARPFLDPQVTIESDEKPGWRVTQVDFEDARRRYEERRRRQAKPLMLQDLALLQLAQRAFVRLRQSVDDSGPQKSGSLEKRKTKYLREFGGYYCDCPPEYVEFWNVTRRILARLNREVRAMNARLLVMSVPAIEEVDEDVMMRVERKAPEPDRLCLEQAPANQRLGELLAELDVAYLDLLPAFRAASRPTGVELFRRSDDHWNPQGHALAARELAAALERGSYLVSHGGAR